MRCFLAPRVWYEHREAPYERSLRIFPRGILMTQSSERRDGPRIDLRLRVRYDAGGVTGEAEASDVSPRGLRLESEAAVEAGSDIHMVVDAGDEEELKASGRVTWCRARQSPAGGKTMFDIGVAFAEDWLAQDRGPLGSALARIFTMNSYEPARRFERTQIQLNAIAAGAALTDLEVADISEGGLQLKAASGDLDERVQRDHVVRVDMEHGEKVTTVKGKIVWISSPNFGVQFDDGDGPEQWTLKKVVNGEIIPNRMTVVLETD